MYYWLLVLPLFQQPIRGCSIQACLIFQIRDIEALLSL